MKKLLIASTALLATAGIAAADVKISGNGRFGLVYDDTNSQETVISHRLRFNIDASKETDAGVKFGGRLRLQYEHNYSGDTIENGEGAAEVNAAMLYVETSGFRVEVGNANTAFDSLNLLYNAEVGFISSTFAGYSFVDYTSYRSNPYSSSQANRVGVFASYTVGDLVARISYVTPDQLCTSGCRDDEVSISFDYATGPFSFGFGYVSSGDFNTDYEAYALLGEYAINDTTNVGLQIVGDDDDTTVTLYGNTEFNGISVGAYLGTTDAVGTTEDIAIGIGASYDIGGAKIAGSIQKGFNDETYADVGVNFSF